MLEDPGSPNPGINGLNELSKSISFVAEVFTY